MDANGLISQVQLLTQLTSKLITLTMRLDKVNNDRFRPVVSSALFLLQQYKEILDQQQIADYLTIKVDESRLDSDDLAVATGLKQLCSDTEALLISEDIKECQEKVDSLLGILKIIFPPTNTDSSS